MKTILLYPAFDDPALCADVFSRVFWYFAPYERYIASVSAFAPFEQVPLDVPDHIDPTAVTAAAGKKVLEKVTLATALADHSGWDAAIEAADIVLVWSVPDEESDQPYESLKSMQRRFGQDKIFAVDEVKINTGASNMMSAALSLIDDEEELLAQSAAKLATFKERITLPVGYVFGTGPSLEEAWRYDYSDGHCIVCNSIVKNAPLLDKLNPIALMAGDPIFHAGPSTYAAAFRESLASCMAERDFHLFVPWRDYGIYLTYLPEDLHERIIGIPLYNGDDYNIDIEKRFAVLGLPNVLTLLLLPVAATFFEHVGISGCDGRPLSQNSYFWGHHKASQFGDQMDAIQRAHPGFFSISYNDYYLRHCAETERLCQDIEKAGKTVHAVTASFIPALRKRGAAEPLSTPKGEAEVDTLVLSLAPDLASEASADWAAEKMLAAKVEAGGKAYGLIANVAFETILQAEPEARHPIEKMSFGLKTKSSVFAYGTALSDKERAALMRRVARELASALEGALLDGNGRIHVLLRKGSLEHAEILYPLVKAYPRLSLEVTLEWLQSQAIWQADFLRRWMWLLEAAERDARFALVCATAHQAANLEERSGFTFPVAARPSASLDDDQAWELLNSAVEQPSTARILLHSDADSPVAAEERAAIASALTRSMPLGQSEILISERLPDGLVEEPAGMQITSIDQGLGGGPSLEALQSSRALVLPQLPPTFADRTSGVAVDALYVGTPMVVQRGTGFARLVERYQAGIVAGEGSPDELAEGAAALAARSNGQRQAQRNAAKDYYRQNSWHRLAQDTLDRLPTPTTCPLVPAAPESETVLVPLVGPIPRAQAARTREIQAVATLLEAMGVPFAKGGLIEQAPRGSLQFLTSDGQGLILVDSETAETAVKNQIAGLSDEQAAGLKVMRAPHKDSKAVQQQAAAVAAGLGEGQHSILVIQDPDLAPDSLTIIEALGPLAAVIDFDDAERSCHAQVARDLADLGYLVLISEQHPRLRRGEPDLAWRIAAYPFVSDLPWARGRLLALPPNALLGYLKYLLTATGDNMAFVDPDDPKRRSREVWDDAPLMNPERIVAHAPAPSALWRREAFTVTGNTPEGLTRLEESEATRVHRSYLAGEVRAGEPVTLSVDCAALQRRFVMLWISDRKNNSRAGATFDLQSGTPVTIEDQLDDKSAVIEAGAVQLGETREGRPLYRIWLTIPSYPTSEEVLGQLLTRSAASGSRQHKGTPGRGVMARDFLLELSPGPSKIARS
ncbi:MAG: hypothetical protein AAFY02_18050 [Pseudomonadota bacterium]